MGLAALLLVAASPADTPLPVGGPELERAVAAGESQAFVAALAAGRAYHLAVEQRGIDVVIAVHGPEGSSVATVDGPLDRWGVETVLLRPVAAGSYRVEVRTEKKGVGAGRYAIRLDELPGATPADRERLAALEAMTRGGAALVGRPAGSLDKALAAFQEAREHCKAAGDRRWETESLAALAAVAHLAGRQRQAVDSYRELATRWQELQQPARELRAWADLGLTLWEMSDLPAADDALARGLTLAERLGETYSKTELQSTQCLVLHARGAVQPALDCYREVRALYHQLGEAQEEASVLNNLGYAYYNLGEPQPAEENYRQALAIRQTIGDRAGEAQALNNLAVLFRNLGEIDEALADYGAAQKILASLDDRRQEAATANNMGVAYSALGEAERGEPI